MHLMLRFYKKHNLASKLFLFNKEIQVEICLECFIDFLCLHFWHDCCCLESSVSLSLITMSSPEERLSYDEPLSPVGTMESGLVALFVTPSSKKMMEMATNFSMTYLLLTRGSHWAWRLQRVFWTMVSIRLFHSPQRWFILLYGIWKGLFWKTAGRFTW